MERNVIVDVTPLEFPSPHTLPLELVERKGIGHPDTICDALAETVSGGLSRFYLERFGSVLHHNVDKALLCGGTAQPAFGGGEIIAPIEIHLAGRATRHFKGIEIPVDDIAVQSCRHWLHEHLSHLDVQRDVRIIPHIRSTSPDLASLFQRENAPGVKLANDTSFGVGFAPLDTLETTVLAVERKLNALEIKRAQPDIGEDIKVMGARRGRDIALTIACALVGRHVTDMEDYFAKKSQVRALAFEAARLITDLPLHIDVNAADRDSPDSIYLTVTGLSAESGDDGQVGRGNRVNGLITPYRPMSLEATAGKNPVTHVGKLYNVIASRVAQAVVTQVPQVEEVYCYLLGRIGHPIGEPQVFDVKIRSQDTTPLEALVSQVREVARAAFAPIDSVWREAAAGTLQLW